MNDQEIEREIVSKGLTAPRVTPEDIERNIVAEHYFDAFSASAMGTAKYNDGHTDAHVDTLRLITFCILVLKNGFKVTGDSACVSPENFDAELGKKAARQKAIDKMWDLMGYALKDRLHNDKS